MRSRIYQGWVRHCRERPRRHAFRYRFYMMYLDLDELDRVFRHRWLWSVERPNLASFRRRDHFGDPGQDLSTAVRKLVAAELGRTPAGPVCLLTHLRYFGYCMNPVSFYYCWNHDASGLDAIVAEVHNTPWGETHCYVLDPARGEPYEFNKAFHVSPFMSMSQQYRWRLSEPGRTLAVSMHNYENGQRVFNASMGMRELDITAANLATVLTRYPFMTGKVIGAIYWQALRLWIKKTPFYGHPGRIRTRQVER